MKKMTEPKEISIDIPQSSENIEKYKIKTPKYLINEDNSYKILLLYTLRNLNKDSIQIIYNLLLTHEIIDLMKETWLETILENNDEEDFRNNDIYLDIDSEGHLDYY